MTDVYILDARRTPIGRFGGGLKTQSAADLAVCVGEAMLTDVMRPHIGQVILGQVLQAGCGMNVARQVALRLGLPQSVPGTTVNLMCGSGLQAVSLGTLMIRAGETQLVLAGGTESMSRAPHYAPDLRWGRKLGDSMLTDSIFVDGLTDPLLKIGMGETAEALARRFSISRAEQDAFAARSQALVAGMEREIVPVTTREGIVASDEHPRSDTTAEKLAALKPAFLKDGTVTAGNASGINDGASLVLLGSGPMASELGLQKRARIVASAVVGCDPAEMGIGPVEAVREVCRRAEWSLEEVDLVEINEAFAAQALACVKALHLDLHRVNVRGGAIALGHPIGASGARVLTTLLHALEDRELRCGIATLCIGGGMGIAMAIERCVETADD